MQLPSTFFAVSIAALVCSPAHFFSILAPAQTADSGVSRTSTEKPSWLEGTGADLKIKVTGQLLDKSGGAVTDCKLTARLSLDHEDINLPTKIDGSRFQLGVPVGKGRWFNLHLNATSADGQLIGRKAITCWQLRQTAIDGLRVTVTPPDRTVQVVVAQDGKPVADALVIAEIVAGAKLTEKTDGGGVARFPLMKNDELSQLTAYTDDFRIGGCSFHREPKRDPSGSKHRVELERCRPQVIRVISDEDETPVRDLPFILTVGTGAPNYRYLGQIPALAMKADAKGVAICRWFPDWKEHHCYVTLLDPHWTKVAIEEPGDGPIVVKMKKSRWEERKRVVGQATSSETQASGFFVELSSFEGEEENRLDALYAFTDENGRFAADVLPGSTYSVCVNDSRYVSEIIDLIPKEIKADKQNKVLLSILKGQPVEITATEGPMKAPIAHQWVNLETPHEAVWRTNGQTRHGVNGRRWSFFTDENGRAVTYASAGSKLQGSLNVGSWSSEQSVLVKSGEATKLAFHRAVAKPRKIAGRLVLPPDVKADLNDAVLEVGSVDGETQERLIAKANGQGAFDFQSQASRLGILARTKDTRFAALAILDKFDEPIELKLKPTGELQGRVLGKDRPQAGHRVRASVEIKGTDKARPWLTSFSAAVFESKTDDQGNYSISGLPYEIAVSLTAQSLEGRSDREESLGQYYLIPNEARPRMIHRLWKPERKTSFADRYQTTLRDCRLANFRPMVILFRESQVVKDFVDANFMDYENTREVSSFMQILGALGERPADGEIADFARERDWPLPKPGMIFAVALDDADHELGRIQIDCKDPNTPKLAADFIRQHAPPAADAKKKWEEAFAQAKQSGRKVWVRISQRYCGPCFRLTRWFDDQKALLGQDYVMLKIDDVRDLHALEFVERLQARAGDGVPFHAIFDADGKMLINSAGPLGNIGCPGGFESKRHLRKMLQETRGKLTDKQIQDLLATIAD